MHQTVKRRISVWEYLHLIKGLIPVMGLILAVLGTIIFGIATPTEASGAGALVAMIIAAFYRKLSRRLLWNSALRAVESLGMIMILIAGAVAFATVFLGLGGDNLVMEVVDSLGLGSFGVVIFALIVVVFLGMFIDWAGILYITIPVFIPLIALKGIEPLWFALLMCTTLQTAWLTPPFGFSIFYVKSIVPQDIQYGTIVRGCLPFFVLQILGVALCIMFPDIITWLPGLIYH